MSLEGTRMQFFQFWRPDGLITSQTRGAAEAKPAPFLLPEEASPAREHEVVPWASNRVQLWMVDDIVTLLPYENTVIVLYG